jgi:hypothetical protein
MAIIERFTHYPQKMSEAIGDKEAKYIELETKAGGFPPKKYMIPIYGKETNRTFIWEREWESIEVMEATYNKVYYQGNEEANAVHRMEPDFGPLHREIFQVIEPKK